MSLGLVFAALATAIVGFGQLPTLREFGGPKSAMSGWPSVWSEVWAWGSIGGVVLVVCVAMMLVVRVYHRDLLRSLSYYLWWVIAFLLASRAILLFDLSPFLIPLPLLAVFIALVYGARLAIHTAIASAFLVGLMVTLHDPERSQVGAVLRLSEGVAISLVFGSIIAALGCSRIRSRTRLVVIGFASGIGQLVIVAIFQACCLTTSEAFDWTLLLREPVFGFLNGFSMGILVTSALPFLERGMGLTTDMHLLELSDQNRPLLRELSLLAPGSFQHSLMVSQLAEEAAQSIGANDLLARVGALYHDIGKITKPNYFIENIRGDDEQGGENIHDRLSPEMSRLIIISHVKDGIRIAEEEGLPKPIVDMIPMHHGTSVVEYFYYKKRRLEKRQDLGETDTGAFQYPGPKPTFKEAGILMLADTTEAVSRVLKDPTPGRLRGVVKQVINKKMADGQLDECALTMRDLHRIEDAFVRVLASIHHGRIKYPTSARLQAATGEEASEPADADDSDRGRRRGSAAADTESASASGSDKPPADQASKPDEASKPGAARSGDQLASR